ncbi:6-phosphofructokinase [Aestuariimicrobium ganziense]|uniref:6-phosphofructokinase n=1 Tax=Aestuariimicrobium ganziense TaxID=2773677 RepID=UPI002E2D51E9|nr:6-phosphofructokinase [Aestuariimicrobium ganziense]
MSEQTNSERPVRLGILTSGGDAQGMNAAVRAAVRTALSRGVEVYTIHEGFQGMIDGGDGITRADWDDVGSILHKGGTVIGTFRSMEFKERAGRLKAARNLVERGIDRLVVIGGDGSLSGADAIRHEWSSLLDELVANGELTREQADRHPSLMIAGLVGSIDNDLVGTDMTIGADTALHRILEAIDALSSTSASHQRRFVVEVMGRHCGYLTLMASIAGGCDYALIPESPPEPGWQDRMAEALRLGREAGRRDSIVVVAEGAQDSEGNPISAEDVAAVIRDRMNEDARVTILGHVQRGGRPSAYDRWASTWLGHEAVNSVLAATPTDEPQVLGIRGNRVSEVPLVKAVADTREVPKLIEAKDFEGAMAMRGGSFRQMVHLFRELRDLDRSRVTEGSKRIAVVHAGGLAPGMNSAVWAAVRLGLHRGHTMLGVRNGFDGLRDGEIDEIGLGDVEGLLGEGGAWLGTRRDVPKVEHLYSISRTLEQHRVDALLVIGGFNAYEGAWLMDSERTRYPAFDMPIVCVPASIDNNLPGSELSIGADTALNAITESIDRIKQSGTATKRCFVVETMGRNCGYLALVAGMAGGAERTYLHEEGITLADLHRDVAWMQQSFASGRRIFLAVRSEDANDHYTTDFLARLFEEEGGKLFDVRQSVLGHIQQGGNPTPFDRLLATRLVSRAIDQIAIEFEAGTREGWYLGLDGAGINVSPLARMHDEVDLVNRRPKKQWWLQLRPIVRAVAQGPDA